MVERYSSGTSLSKTDKDDRIDSLEGALWTEFTDEFFVALKKLTVTEIKELHRLIQERISGAHEEEAGKYVKKGSRIAPSFTHRPKGVLP